MSLLKFAAFGGEVPRMAKRDLPDDAGQVAENLFADTREFRPVPLDTAPVTVGLAAADDIVNTLYRYPTDSASIVGTQLHVSVVRSTIADDEYDRVYASTLSSEPLEFNPHILQAGKSPNDPTLRNLGVPYPTAPLALVQATIDDALLKPNEVTDFTNSILQTIKSIALEAVETVKWNKAFNLNTKAGFRESPDNANSGFWQRILTYTTSTNSWNTYNGQPIERFMWATKITNPPFYTDSPGVLTFHIDLPGYAWIQRVKSDVTVQVNKLKALVAPGTTNRVITDDEIDALFALMRQVFADDPTASSRTELRSIANKLISDYIKLVNYLEFGFGSDVTPQAGYQLVTQAMVDLTAGAEAGAAFYNNVLNVEFEKVLLEYFQQTRLIGVLPQGTMEIVEVRYYTYTLVNPYGEESKPYLPGDGNSNTELPFLSCNQVQTATITLPGTLPAGVGSGWKWRVYRSAAGANSASFLFVTEVPIATTSFTDLRPTDALAEPMRTTSWFPPPIHTSGGTRHLKNMVQMPGQFMAGFVDNTVYFSEPNHPYAWPPQYAIPLNDDIIALGVFGVTLVVLTKGRPVYISGNSPESVSRVDMESIETCVSPRSVVPVSGGVVFASQNGLCIATQSGLVNMTSRLYTRTEWAALGPENMVCEEFDGVVYFTRPNIGKMGAYHVQSGKLVTFDLNPTALYSDHSTGALYAALPPVAGQIAKSVLIQKGTGVRTAKWRSKRIILASEVGFAWLSVEGEQSVTNPLNVDIYGYYIDPATNNEHIDLLETAKGNGTYSAVVTDTRPIRIQTGRYKDFELEVSGKCRVTSVVLASSTDELKGVN